MTTAIRNKPASEPLECHALSRGRRISIGDGFSARSYQYTDFKGLMDPLIMVDHFVMTEPTFGTHPHAGLSAVTVVFEDSQGTFRNQDSLGNDIDLAPGDLYWFQAARGALHNEQPRPGASTHALQVFVNLPSKKRQDAPSAFHVHADKVPSLGGHRSEARVVLGRSGKITGAAEPNVPLTILDIDIQAGGSFAHQGQQDNHFWMLAIGGASTVIWSDRSAQLNPGIALALKTPQMVSLRSEDGAHVVLFEGAPLHEAFVQRGPFAMGSEAELDAVEADYHAGRLGKID